MGDGEGAAEPPHAQPLHQGGEPFGGGRERGGRGGRPDRAQQARHLLVPDQGGARQVLAQGLVEDGAGAQLAPGAAVLPYFGGVLELQQQGPIQLLARAQCPGARVAVGGVALGAVVDELQRPEQDSGAVLEVVVDQRGGDARFGRQLLHAQATHPAPGDHPGGGFENLSAARRHGPNPTEPPQGRARGGIRRRAPRVARLLPPPGPPHPAPATAPTPAPAPAPTPSTHPFPRLTEFSVSVRVWRHDDRTRPRGDDGSRSPGCTLSPPQHVTPPQQVAPPLA